MIVLSIYLLTVIVSFLLNRQAIKRDEDLADSGELLVLVFFLMFVPVVNIIVALVNIVGAYEDYSSKIAKRIFFIRKDSDNR